MGNIMVPSNSPTNQASLVSTAANRLSALLPRGWAVKSRQSRLPRGMPDADAVFEITGPDKSSALVLVETKRLLRPKDAQQLTETAILGPDWQGIVVAPFIGEEAARILFDSGWGYVDATGNTYLSVKNPGLLIRTTGATINPWPQGRTISLGGAKAGRLVRALADFTPPYGVRELSTLADIDAGYASRLLDFLRREGIIERTPRGGVAEVDWNRLVSRWSKDYSVLVANRALRLFEPRSLDDLISKLSRDAKKSKLRYALTGSWAASRSIAVSSVRQLMIYVDNAEVLRDALGLKTSATATNVILLEPFDPIVFERATLTENVYTCALSQVVADLLNTPGRSSEEASALLDWMKDNEGAWRREPRLR